MGRKAIWFPLMSYAVNTQEEQTEAPLTRSHATYEIPEKKNLNLMALIPVLSRVREKSGKEACRGLKYLDNGGKPQLHCYILSATYSRTKGKNKNLIMSLRAMALCTGWQKRHGRGSTSFSFHGTVFSE